MAWFQNGSSVCLSYREWRKWMTTTNCVTGGCNGDHKVNHQVMNNGCSMLNDVAFEMMQGNTDSEHW